MKKINRTVIAALILFPLLTGSLPAGDMEMTKKFTFTSKESVVIQTVSGDCKVEGISGKKIFLEIQWDYPADCFKPEAKEENGVLKLKEHFTGSCSGRSYWKLKVPLKTAISFKSASGDLVIRGVKGKVDSSTASGDVDLANITGAVSIRSASGDIRIDNLSGDLGIKSASGDIRLENITGSLEAATASGDLEIENLSGDDIEIKAASGDIDIEGMKGTLEVKTASGEIEATGVAVTGASEFKSASGDVEITLAAQPAHDLTLVSASGDAVLDYNGIPLKGFFEFSAKKDSGRIVSPVAFDREESTYKYGQEYMVKSFSVGGKAPRITIKTASGRAELEK